MRHVILISGKDSLATAIVQIGREPNLPYELVHNEVGWDLPETLEWIERVGKHLEKIKPLNEFLGKTPATIYFGLRADEPERVGYDAPRYQTPCYPLREVGYTLSDVWRMCQSVDLLPPQFHWGWMESRVRELLRGDDWLLDSLEPWERASLLAWRSRSNCDRCFYARLYEVIGLYEHYPDRFLAASRMEIDLCHGKAEFAWRQGYRLSELLPRAEAIKEKRAKSIVKFLRTRQQRSLFEDDETVDLLAVTSCGLLCGK